MEQFMLLMIICFVLGFLNNQDVAIHMIRFLFLSLALLGAAFVIWSNFLK